MANIKAADVSNLRKTSGAGMMDCKNALVEAEGNFEEAIKILRKKGQKIAAKRADRETNEGATIAITNDENTVGVVIALMCETDFVAKNDDFVKLAKQLASVAIDHNSLDAFLNATIDGMTVTEKLTEQTGLIGEKIEIGSFKRVEGAFVGSYIHAGNRIATVSALGTNIENATVIAKDVAMQAAAMGAIKLSHKEFTADYIESETEARIAAIKKDNIEFARLGKHIKEVPTYVSRSQLTDEVLNNAKNNMRAELLAEGKPENIVDKILVGKLESFITKNTLLDQEQCLLDQKFIKDEKITVAEYLQQNKTAVIEFERVSLIEA
jgi:elongation factor Ts